MSLLNNVDAVNKILFCVCLDHYHSTKLLKVFSKIPMSIYLSEKQ